MGHLRGQEALEKITKVVHRAQLYMSSVVAMELRAGCRTRRDSRILEQLLAPFVSAGRIVTPHHAIFWRAGQTLADLGQRTGLDAAARRRLVNDVLIALSAVSIGAALVTEDRADFKLIAQDVPLVWFSSVDALLAAET